MPYPTAEQLDEAGLRLDADGPILTVTLNRPDVRNAQTPATWRTLAAIGEALDSDVRVVVLRGEGTAFSAGLDRRMMTPEGIAGEPTFTEIAALPDDAALTQIASYQAAFTWWRRPDTVSVAAVQGAAVGAGFQLALACDLRVVADDVRFAMREPSLGLVPDLGGTQPLVEILGYGRALEICATGRWIDADEAMTSGLAIACVRPPELNDTVSDLVAAMAMAPADAVRATKALLVGAAGRSYGEQLAAERRAQLVRLRDLAGRLG